MAELFESRAVAILINRSTPPARGQDDDDLHRSRIGGSCTRNAASTCPAFFALASE